MFGYEPGVPMLDIFMPCLWDECRCEQCAALEVTGARDDQRFIEVQ